MKGCPVKHHGQNSSRTCTKNAITPCSREPCLPRCGVQLCSGQLSFSVRPNIRETLYRAQFRHGGCGLFLGGEVCGLQREGSLSWLARDVWRGRSIGRVLSPFMAQEASHPRILPGGLFLSTSLPSLCLCFFQPGWSNPWRVFSEMPLWRVVSILCLSTEPPEQKKKRENCGRGSRDIWLYISFIHLNNLNASFTE